MNEPFSADQPGRLGRAGRTHFCIELDTGFGNRGGFAVAQPVEIAQGNAVRIERFARADDHTGRIGIEVNDVKRFA